MKIDSVTIGDRVIDRNELVSNSMDVSIGQINIDLSFDDMVKLRDKLSQMIEEKNAD